MILITAEANVELEVLIILENIDLWCSIISKILEEGLISLTPCDTVLCVS